MNTSIKENINDDENDDIPERKESLETPIDYFESELNVAEEANNDD